MSVSSLFINISHSAAARNLGSTPSTESVTNRILEVLSPLGLKAALQASERLSGNQSEIRQQRVLALEQARYEASRAKRQYDSVDPLCDLPSNVAPRV
jgi:HEAT repeat protein